MVCKLTENLYNFYNFITVLDYYIEQIGTIYQILYKKIILYFHVLSILLLILLILNVFYEIQ